MSGVQTAPNALATSCTAWCRLVEAETALKAGTVVKAVVVRTGEPVRTYNRYRPNVPYGQTNTGLRFRIPIIERVGAWRFQAAPFTINPLVIWLGKLIYVSSLCVVSIFCLRV